MKKSLKILLVIILVAAVLIGGYFGFLQIMKKQARDTIENMFTAFKSGDENQIKEFINIDDAVDNSEDESEGSEMEKIMLKKLDYEIESLDCKFNQCTVKLKVTNKDLKTVFQNYMTKAISLAFSQATDQSSDGDIESQLKDFFEEQYDSDSVENVSTEITVSLNREQGKWKVSCDEDKVVDAILPGYRDFIEYVDSFDSGE